MGLVLEGTREVLNCDGAKVIGHAIEILLKFENFRFSESIALLNKKKHTMMIMFLHTFGLKLVLALSFMPLLSYLLACRSNAFCRISISSISSSSYGSLLFSIFGRLAKLRTVLLFTSLLLWMSCYCILMYFYW